MRLLILGSYIVFAICAIKLFAQEPLVSNTPPAILITPDSSGFGEESVIDSLQSLRSSIDKAQAAVDSLSPANGFSSAAHRAAYYKAASQLKSANVGLFSYMAQVDPSNRLGYLAKARLSKRQAELAMAEYYKALPSEGVPVVEHHRLNLN